jgi:hypothetical protein
MAKWADYLISQVLYDQNHIITKVKQHRDIGNKISGGEIVDRDAIANNLGHGIKYMTVYGDLGKIRMGKNVRYFRAYEDHYIRIDDNKVTTDNLGELPGLVESQQEEKPVLAETKLNPGVETKPLSELSSAFFAEQVEQEPEPVALETEVTPEPAAVETKVTPEPVAVETEVTPEPAAVETKVTPEPVAVETEVTPKETKKKVMKTKSSTKKKSAKKKPTKKKSAKKKPTKKKSAKKKSTKKKSAKKKPTKKKSAKKKPTKKKRA